MCLTLINPWLENKTISKTYYIFRGGPPQHLDLIQKLQNNMKTAKKSFQKLLKDFAIAEAEKLERMPKPLPKFYSLHRKDGIEPDFISTFLRNVPEGISLYFLSVSEPAVGRQPSKGHMVLKGDVELVEHFGPIFMEILDGKGNGQEGIYQGKINDSDKIRQCEAMLEKHFSPEKTPKASAVEKPPPAEGS